VQTAGVCLLELLDRREHFADHAGPDDGCGVPGWHVITSGAVGLGSDARQLLKVRLPIRLDDGRTVVYLAWVYLQAVVIDDFVQRVHDDALAGHRFEGLLCNPIGPWGEDVLRAPVVIGGQRINELARSVAARFWSPATRCSARC
jgi:hypothetical protein